MFQTQIWQSTHLSNSLPNSWNRCTCKAWSDFEENMLQCKRTFK